MIGPHFVRLLLRQIRLTNAVPAVAPARWSFKYVSQYCIVSISGVLL
jgi:hypothetical protein